MDQAKQLRSMFQFKNETSLYQPELTSRVITVTSGKGGVGKTNFVASLAVYLRGQGKRVIILDADLGLANIELLFDIMPEYSLADVLSGNKKMEEVIAEGPMGIKFISGGSGLKEMANMTERQIMRLIDNFEHLDSMADIILIDTGAGISKAVLNFVRASNETILITTPEPTSLTDAYALIKAAKEEDSNTPDFKIVVNRADDLNEGNEIYEKLSKVSSRFLGINLEYLGFLPYDNNLVKAVKRQEPVAISFPDTAFSKSLEVISFKLFDINYSITPEKHLNILSFVKRLVNIFGG